MHENMEPKILPFLTKSCHVKPRLTYRFQNLKKLTNDTSIPWQNEEHIFHIAIYNFYLCWQFHIQDNNEHWTNLLMEFLCMYCKTFRANFPFKNPTQPSPRSKLVLKRITFVQTWYFTIFLFFNISSFLISHCLYCTVIPHFSL